VAEMVTDLLQAQPLSDQVRRAGMAKTMWAVVRGLDAQGAQAAADRVEGRPTKGDETGP